MRINSISNFRLLPDSSGIELTVESDTPDQKTLVLSADILMKLVEACSAGAVAISKKQANAIPYLLAEGAQAPLATEKSVAIEIAFGTVGHLYFDISRETSRKLVDQIERHLMKAGTKDRLLPRN